MLHGGPKRGPELAINLHKANPTKPVESPTLEAGLRPQTETKDAKKKALNQKPPCPALSGFGVEG